MSLPEAVIEDNRKEVERLLRSGSDVNQTDGVRYIIKHVNHKFVYIFRNIYYNIICRQIIFC